MGNPSSTETSDLAPMFPIRSGLACYPIRFMS